MDDLVKAFYAAEALSPAFWWVEKVPSKSSPADEPSGALGREAAALWNAIFRDHFSCQESMVKWLTKAASNRTLGI